MKRILAVGPYVLLAIISISSGVFVARHFASSTERHRSNLQGRPLGADIDWSRSDRTLILALQIRCKYCADSMSFYRLLVPNAANNGIRVVGIFPDDTSQAGEYLSASGLVLSEIHQSNLASLGITGTPTILLVNKDGLVQKAWEGKIPATAEQDILSAVNDNAAK